MAHEPALGGLRRRSPQGFVVADQRTAHRRAAIGHCARPRPASPAPPFAFASEPWENATRADVHAVSILFVTVVLWLLLTWRAAERAGSPRAGGWLVGAALAFGLGLGVHPIIGLFAFGIVAWLFVVDRRLLAATAADRAVRRGRCARARLLRLHLGARHHRSGAAALLRPPDTWERFRYLVLAEQFGHLFRDFREPLCRAGREVGRRRARPRRPVRRAGLAAGRHRCAAVVAARSLETFAVLLLFVIVNVCVLDELPRRRHRPLLHADRGRGLPRCIGVALAAIAAACGRAMAECRAAAGLLA